MRVGIVDVGANTARLLVAQTSKVGLERVHEERTTLALGAEIEQHGEISERKRAEVAEAVAAAAANARGAGAQRVEVLVTSPGRQCRNPSELERALVRAVGPRVRLLTADEEARLAFAGALAASRVEPVNVAVCDVGGGSAQIALGSALGGPSWTGSIGLGSLRLTRRHVRSDPPTRADLRAARLSVSQALGEVSLPRPQTALATGGTARALRKLVGPSLGRAEFDEALAVLSHLPARKISTRFAVPEWRAALLPAGALILNEIQHRLDKPLTVARGGVREGAALELLERTAAAA